MKELSIEEKAKRYDEALIKARNIVNSINVGLIGKDSFEAVFPELKESGDERIRKVILDYFKDYKTQEAISKELSTFFGIPTDNIIAWLEKQGEKPTEWSEKDKCMINNIIDTLKPLSQTTHSGYAINSMITWLKSLKPQSRQEWSVEDDKKLIERLKSLRPQTHWKPSDEQMNILEQWLKDNQYKGDARYCYPIFESLYQDLKKLKG